MRTGTVAFRSAKRQVADMKRSASVQFVERDFDPGLPQRVLWSNFRRLGFCNSSDFSSLGVGVEDFADKFANVPFLLFKYRLPRGTLVDFRFVILVSSNVFRRLRVSLLMPWGRTVFLLNVLNYCFHLFFVMCCMFSIMQSPLLFFLLSGRWLLFGRLLRLVHLLVPTGFRPISIVSVFV
jgi:hypothetical protein